ncbi:MAG: Hsp20/alpha crystallin family protein [Planctomycetota bacterium]|nr:MAG: Hsp20/alpha crystallin family protein [Planctomycetota bacterium]REJ89095.1 MAG: Hsp20/alpha crystallin family protein [Planctomycetota bacterium]
MTRISTHPFAPLTRVGSDLDRIFSGAFDRDFARFEGSRSPRGWAPPLDVTEEDDTYHFEVDVPGFRLEDIDVTIEGRKVTIAGKPAREDATEHDGTDEPTTPRTIHLRERHADAFSRTVTMPVHVDATKAEASLSDGVLSLRVPKAEAARQHKIEVRAS